MKLSDEHQKNDSRRAPGAVLPAEQLHIFRSIDTDGMLSWVRVSDAGEKAIALADFSGFLEMYSQETLEAPWEDEADLAPMIADAKRCVEELFGQRLDTEIRIEPNGQTLREEKAHLRAYYDELDGVVTTHRVPEIDSFPLYARRKNYVGHFVHEFSHATKAATRKIILFINGTSLECGISSGMEVSDLHKDSYTRNSFFEEALAEGMAGRWRMQYDGNRYVEVKLRVSPQLDTKSELSARYISMDHPATGHEDMDEEPHSYSESAFCASGIDELSEYIGQDLYQLMIDARDPEKEAVSRRRLTQIIESVEPGLYKKLRDLSYSRENFIRGQTLIHEAIKRAEHERLSRPAKP